MAAEHSQQNSDGAKTRPKAKAKRFIKSTVSIHDRTQIETVFDYYLYRGKAATDSRQLNYRVEAFLFYPRQFGLDPQTYPKERFYNDVRPLIRFREPRLSYKQLRGSASAAHSPLAAIAKFIDDGQHGALGLTTERAVDDVRIFACSLIGTFMRSLDRRRKRFLSLSRSSDSRPPDQIAGQMRMEIERLQGTLRKVESVVLEFRALTGKALLLPKELRQAVHAEMRLVDEYLYYRLHDGLAQLLVMGDELRRHGGGVATVLLTDVRALLQRFEAHAEDQGYIRIDEDSPTQLKERYIHRRGELKRRIWQVLFLQIRNTPLFAFQQQMGAMVAAGLAAFWAVAAQIMIIEQATSGQSATELFRTGGIVFITAAVLAYVIKDRIKEIGRSYFRGRLFRTIPDQSESIYYEDKVVGSNRETAKFLQINQLPSDVEALRARAISSAFENEEVVDGVLHYTKDIELSRAIRILGQYPLKAVHDILRINIDACLPRLGEPTRVHHAVGPDGHVQPLLLPKVYYLDMALRYSKLGERGVKAQERIDYFRLVIDKNGLLRIDQLAESKATGFVSSN